MKKFYFSDLWRINESDLFSSKETLEEYVADNWEDYAYPIGDEKVFVALREGKLHGTMEIAYRVRDYDYATDTHTEWVEESETIWVDTVQLTELVRL